MVLPSLKGVGIPTQIGLSNEKAKDIIASGGSVISQALPKKESRSLLDFFRKKEIDTVQTIKNQLEAERKVYPERFAEPVRVPFTKGKTIQVPKSDVLTPIALNLGFGNLEAIPSAVKTILQVPSVAKEGKLPRPTGEERVISSFEIGGATSDYLRSKGLSPEASEGLGAVVGGGLGVLDVLFTKEITKGITNYILKNVAVPDEAAMVAWKKLGMAGSVEEAETTAKNLLQEVSPNSSRAVRQGTVDEVLTKEINQSLDVLRAKGIPKRNVVLQKARDIARALETDVQQLTREGLRPEVEAPFVRPVGELPGFRPRPGQAPAFGLSTQEIEPVGRPSKVPEAWKRWVRESPVKTDVSFGTKTWQAIAQVPEKVKDVFFEPITTKFKELASALKTEEIQTSVSFEREVVDTNNNKYYLLKAGEEEIGINRTNIDPLLKLFPDAEIVAKDSSSPVVFKKGGEVVGLAMPMKEMPKVQSISEITQQVPERRVSVPERSPITPEKKEVIPSGEIIRKEKEIERLRAEKIRLKEKEELRRLKTKIEFGIEKEITKEKISGIKEIEKLRKTRAVEAIKQKSDVRQLRTVLRFETKIAKNYQAHKEAISRITAKFKAREVKIDNIKRDIFEYAKITLPLEVRGKLLVNVAKAKTKGDLAGAFRKIIIERNRIFRKKATEDIVKIVDGVDSLPIRQQTKIAQLTADVSFKGISEKTKDKLEKLRDFLRKEPEEIYKFGAKTIRKVEKIPVLEQRNVNDIPVKELVELRDRLLYLEGQGVLEKRVVGETVELQRENLLKQEIAPASENMDVGEPPPPATKLTKEQEWGNTKRNAKEFFKKAELGYYSVDIGFEILDKNKSFGTNWRTFKGSYDEKNELYQEAVGELQERYFAKKSEILSKYGKKKFEKFEQERIMLYATKKQIGGLEKLERTDPTGKLRKQAESIELNESEMELYKLMRSIFDELRPKIDEVFQKVRGEKLGQVENYFSWQTDFDNSDFVLERIQADYNLTSRTQQGFTKERTLAGRQKIRLNAEDVFLKHINDSTYFIHTEELLNELGKIARDIEYQKAVGKIGQKWVLGWIDLMARKGVPKDYTPSWYTPIVRNIGSGILGFKVSPIVKQPISKITSVSLLGKDAFLYDKEFFSENLGESVRLISRQQRFRSFDDPAYRELAKQKKLAAWQKVGYAGIKWADQIIADSVWYSAYRKWAKDNGKEFVLEDFKKGIAYKEGVRYADYITRRTQGSSEPKDLARMLTGENRDIIRAVFQFQQFVLNQSYLIPYDAVKKSARTEKNYGKAIGIIMAVFLASLAEDYVQTGMSQIFSSEESAKKELETPLWKRFTDAMANLFPGFSNVYNAYEYGSTGIVTVDEYQKILKGLKTAVSAKEEKAKLKGITRVAEAIGNALGVAGTSQTTQILRKFIGEPEKSIKEPKGLPSLETESLKSGELPSLKGVGL